MKRIYKILILLVIILLTSISIFIIYEKTYTNTYTFLSIGDGLSLGLNPDGIKSFGYNEYIKDYLKDKKIKYNYLNYSEKDISIKELTNELLYLKNDILEDYLRKSNIVILSIGEHEINTNKSSISIKEDLEILIKELKKYNNNICLLGRYSSNKVSNEKINNINNIYKEISKSHKLKYIDIDYIYMYLPNNENLYPNTKGYENISFSIIKAMNIDN